MKVIITLQMNCTVTSFQKTGGARHPLGPMDARPMMVVKSYVFEGADSDLKLVLKTYV